MRGHALASRILAHGRNNDPIGEMDIADGIGGKERAHAKDSVSGLRGILKL
jgi:hypothetical protein